MNLCASYQWFSHAYLYHCKRTIYNIDFMLWITSKQAWSSGKFQWNIKEKPERVYFQTTMTLCKQYFYHIYRCSMRFHISILNVRMLEDLVDSIGEREWERECVCGAMSWMSRYMCAGVCEYQYTFLKTNNSTVLTTT